MRQQIGLTQKQTVSEHLVQSMQVLQMNAAELAEYLQQQALENPVINLNENQFPGVEEIRRGERDWLRSTDLQNRAYYREDGPREDRWRDPLSSGEDLIGYLTAQIPLEGCTAREQRVMAGLIRSLAEDVNRRGTTLQLVIRALAARQKDFFHLGRGHRSPMTLADLAADTGLHPSTVSRALRGKYLQCSWGVFPLGYFLMSAVPAPESSGDQVTQERVQELIRQAVDAEDKRSPPQRRGHLPQAGGRRRLRRPAHRGKIPADPGAEEVSWGPGFFYPPC